MNAIILDTETTGKVEPEPIEIAWRPFSLGGGGFDIVYTRVARFKPSKPIELGALATHNIMDEDLVDMPSADSFTLPPGLDYMIGYKVDYDWEVLGKPKLKRIDVLAMCRHLWPLADSHTLAAMLYMHARQGARAALKDAHGAAADVLLCAAILHYVLKAADPIADLEALWEFSERARVPTIMSFGKHKGMAIADVPRDYKRWLLNQPDVDIYLQKALRA